MYLGTMKRDKISFYPKKRDKIVIFHYNIFIFLNERNWVRIPNYYSEIKTRYDQSNQTMKLACKFYKVNL